MARQEFGAGYAVSRLNVILISLVAFVWAICVFLIILVLIGGSDYYVSKPELLIEKFYNSADSEEACSAVPIIYENSIPNEQSILINDQCKTAHHEFRTLYPEARAIYIIRIEENYYEGYGSENYDIHVKVEAVDKNGNIIDGLSEIIIPIEEMDNPYSTGVWYDSEGRRRFQGFPNYSEIVYKEFNGSDEIWL